MKDHIVGRLTTDKVADMELDMVPLVRERKWMDDVMRCHLRLKLNIWYWIGLSQCCSLQFNMLSSGLRHWGNVGRHDNGTLWFVRLILWRRHSTGSTSSNSPPNSSRPLYYLLKSKMKSFLFKTSLHLTERGWKIASFASDDETKCYMRPVQVN